MLYLIPTPIGNLSDITYRAVTTLKKCDYILCEDTRKSGILLKHLEISKRLISFHKFSEKEKENSIIHDLRSGLEIGLISDAGTPCICDPGSMLIKRVLEEQLPLTSLPGPCALSVAMTYIGDMEGPFQFMGFLPKKAGELSTTLQDAILYPGYTLFYESPHHVQKTLTELAKLQPNTDVTITRELTKIYEEILKDTPSNLLSHFSTNKPRGEMVLIINGKHTQIDLDLPPKEYVQSLIEKFGLSQKDAVLIAAKLQNKPKKVFYQAMIKEN